MVSSSLFAQYLCVFSITIMSRLARRGQQVTLMKMMLLFLADCEDFLV